MKRVRAIDAVRLSLCAIGASLLAAACGGRATLDISDGEVPDSGEVDGPTVGDDGSTQDSGRQVGPDAGGDARVLQDGSFDASHPSDGSTPRDSSLPDVGVHDTGGPDTGGHDTGVPDTGGPDTGGCASGYHEWAGACVDDTSPATCGASCTPCASPANGIASCDGTSCTYTCELGYTVCASGCCSCGDTQNDPNNCGTCGHSCMGLSCVDGVCDSIVIAVGQQNAYAIAADDTYVYWTTTGASAAVLEAPVGGTGGATVLYSSPNTNPYALVASAGDVYFTNFDYPGEVDRIPPGGGTPTTLAGGLNNPAQLTVSNGQVYFFALAQDQFSADILSVGTSGGPVSTIVSDSVAQPESAYPAIAVGGGTVYYNSDIDMLDVPIGGGTPSTFSAMQYAYAIAADANNVYWTSLMTGPEATVLQRPVHGGNTVTLATNQYDPLAIAVDATNVYWTTSQGGTGTVMRAPIGGGTPVTLAAGQPYPNGIALNSTTVFWVNFGDGTIRSVPK